MMSGMSSFMDYILEEVSFDVIKHHIKYKLTKPVRFAIYHQFNVYFCMYINKKLPHQVVVYTFQHDRKDLDQHRRLSCDSHNTDEHISVAP